MLVTVWEETPGEQMFRYIPAKLRGAGQIQSPHLDVDWWALTVTWSPGLTK